MAWDIVDEVGNDGDILLAMTDKYRTYNLLKNQKVFQDNTRMNLDIWALISAGVSQEQLLRAIEEYLVGFGVKDRSFAGMVVSAGRLIGHYEFGGYYV